MKEINQNPERAQEATITHLEALTGGGVGPEVVSAAFDNVTFTVDPIADSLRGGAEHAEAVGLLEPVELEGIYALDPLNDVLAELGREEIAGR